MGILSTVQSSNVATTTDIVLGNIFGDTTTFPKADLLVFLKAPNSGSNYVLPLFAYYAVGDGIFFSNSTTALEVSPATISSWIGINKYHIIFVNGKLLVFDPYTVSDKDIVKTEKYFDSTINPLIPYSSIPNAFFPGTDITDSTATTWPGQNVLDYLGNIVNAGTTQPAIEGARLERVPGGELLTVAQAACDSGWTITGASTVTGGKIRVYSPDGASSYVVAANVCVIGKKYRVSYFIDGIARGTIKLSSGESIPCVSGVTNSIDMVILTNSIGFSRNSGITDVTIDNVSVKELTPQWRSTLPDGTTPILPSMQQPTRTSGTVLDGSELGPELVVNGGFDTNTTSWSPASCTLASVAGGVSGNCLEVTRTAGTLQIAQTTLSGLTVNGKLVFDYYVKSGSSGNEGFIFKVLDSGFVPIVGILGTTSGTSSGGWTKYSATITVPSSTIYPQWCKNSGTDGTMLFDSISGKKVLPALTNVFAPSTTFERFTRANPATDMPGYLSEPASTNELYNSLLAGGANPTSWTFGYQGGAFSSAPCPALPAAVSTTFTVSAARHYLNQARNVLANLTYTLSCEIESVSGSITGASVVWINAAPVGAAVTYPVCAANPSGGSGGVLIAGTLIVMLVVGSTAGTCEYRFGIGCVGNVTGSVTLSRPQVEAKAFKTSFISTPPTAGATRGGTVLSFPTLGKIRSNNQAYRMIVVPRGIATTTYPNLLNIQYDANNYITVYQSSGGISLKKNTSAGTQEVTIKNSASSKDVPIELIWLHSSVYGMICCARIVDAAWLTTYTSATAAAKANVPIGPTYTLGGLAEQFCGNIPLFETLDIPLGIPAPLKWAKKKWGIE